MGRPSPIDDERWKDEAAGAVLFDEDWRCVMAGITLDRSILAALYEHKPTGTRHSVRLARDHFLTVGARASEIHRQLGLRQGPDESSPRR